MSQNDSTSTWPLFRTQVTETHIVVSTVGYYFETNNSKMFVLYDAVVHYNTAIIVWSELSDNDGNISSQSMINIHFQWGSSVTLYPLTKDIEGFINEYKKFLVKKYNYSEPIVPQEQTSRVVDEAIELQYDIGRSIMKCLFYLTGVWNKVTWWMDGDSRYILWWENLQEGVSGFGMVNGEVMKDFISNMHKYIKKNNIDVTRNVYLSDSHRDIIDSQLKKNFETLIYYKQPITCTP